MQELGLKVTDIFKSRERLPTTPVRQVEAERVSGTKLNRQANKLSKDPAKEDLLKDRKYQALESCARLDRLTSNDNGKPLYNKNEKDWEKKLLTKKTEDGTTYAIYSIQSVNEETVTCYAKDESGTGKPIEVTREELVDLQVIAEADALSGFFRDGAEKTVFQAYVTSLRNKYVNGSAPEAMPANLDESILAAAGSIGVPSKNHLIRNLDKTMPLKTYPEGATDETKKQIDTENEPIEAEKKRIIKTTLGDEGNLVNIENLPANGESFSLLTEELKLKIVSLEKLVTLNVGDPVPATKPGEVPSRATQEQLDEWKIDLEVKKIELKTLEDIAKKKPGGLHETFFRMTENGEFSEQVSVGILEAYAEGDVGKMIDIAQNDFEQKAIAEGRQTVDKKKQAMQKKIIMDSVLKYTKVIGGGMALLMFFAMLQGGKQQG